MSFRDKIAGREPVDLLVVNARIINPSLGQVVDGHVAVADGKFAGFGQKKSVKVYDAGGAYIAPGFIDPHTHPETPVSHPLRSFASMLRRGVTTVVFNPSNTANATGLAGVRYLDQTTRDFEKNILFYAPSSVPPYKFEDYGVDLSYLDLACFAAEPRFVGLSEIIDPDCDGMDMKIKLFRNKVVDGHARGLGGRALEEYFSAGASCDHECKTPEEAEERLAIGVRIMARGGSFDRDLLPALKACNSENQHFFSFCTDHIGPSTLLEEGSIDNCVRKAVQSGIPLARAIQMATINTASALKMTDRGSFAVGKRADFVLIDPVTLNVVSTFLSGERVTGELLDYLETCDMGRRPLNADVDFDIDDADFRNSEIVDVRDDAAGQYSSEPVFACVINVRSGQKNISFCRVTGLGRVNGAFATTTPIHSHNIFVLGSSAGLMKKAVSMVAGDGGVSVCGEDFCEFLPLPVFGIYSDSSVARVSEGMNRIQSALDRTGIHEDMFGLVRRFTQPGFGTCLTSKGVFVCEDLKQK